MLDSRNCIGTIAFGLTIFALYFAVPSVASESMASGSPMLCASPITSPCSARMGTLFSSLTASCWLGVGAGLPRRLSGSGG